MKAIRKNILLAGILLFLLGWGVTACGSPSEPIANPALGVDAKTAVTNALFSLTNQSYNMDVTTTLPDGGTRKNFTQFIPPDKKRILDLSTGMEYIIIGQKVYVKTSSTASWAETQIPASTFMGDANTSAQSIGDNLKNVQVVRADSLDGKAVIIYSYDSSTTTSGIELKSQTELWVGDVDGLPYKMLINGEILSSTTDPTTGKNKLSAVQSQTTTVFTFNPTITIEAPIP